MHVLPVNITQEQKTFLEYRKTKTGIDMSVQVRKAIDDYMIKHKEIE